nr:unnamed protein product [Callosobruchus chinensis]
MSMQTQLHPRNFPYRQRDINDQYWQLPKEQQKQFIWDSVKQFKKNRSTTKNKTSPREYVCTYKYYLTSGEAEKVSVCNEECWECEEFEIHKKARSHEANVENLANCDVCKKWKIHKLKATNARKNYQEDAVKIKQEDEIFVAADLQKVIMLPPLETFTEILFMPRIVVYNGSFVPLGKKTKTYPWAVLWHEGVAGRSKDDIISTLYALFRTRRRKWSAKAVVPIRGRTLKHNIIIHLPGLKQMSRNLGNTVDPLAVWSLLFSDDIVEQVVQWTNVKIDSYRAKYKRQSKSEVVDTDCTEVRAFFGMLIYTAVFKGNLS